MRKELDTLEERVSELILLNENLRNVNKTLNSQLNEKIDECEVLRKKIDLSTTSLKHIKKKYFSK